MNTYTFTGNIGKDAELRYTPSGNAVASFSVAVKAGFGERESTVWVRCQLWGQQAERMTAHLLKGARVGVSGELSAREWTDKQGAKQTSLEVDVKQVTFEGKRQDAPEPGSIEQAEQDEIPW